jgi:hypothetical protein
VTKPWHHLVGVTERCSLEQRGNRAQKPSLADRVGGREQELGPVPCGVLKPGRIVVIGVGKWLGALYAGDQLIIGQRLDRLTVTADAVRGDALVYVAILSGGRVSDEVVDRGLSPSFPDHRRHRDLA